MSVSPLKILTGLAVTAAVIYLLLVVLAWKYQDRLAFPAVPAELPTPETLGLTHGERIQVTTADGIQLRGWYLAPVPAPPNGERAPGLIWFPGNMETIEGIAPILNGLRPPGIGLVVLDYRGYGESNGEPTEAAVYSDAEAAWDYLVGRPEIDSNRIALYGRSIGSAVALYLATRRPVRALVLDSPFSTGRDMAKEHYSFFPSSLIRLGLDNIRRAREIELPLMVFHGTEDRIAPIAMGRAVARAGRAEEFIEIPGAGHNDTYDMGGQMYVSRFHRFLNKHLIEANQ